MDDYLRHRPHPLTSRREHLTQIRILIVEDDAIVAEDIRLKVIAMDHDVVGVTGNGKDALRLAAERHPHVVLMDIRLNGPMDGLEAGRLIEDAKGCEVIYVSALPEAFQLSRSVMKPFTAAELARAIQAAIDSRRWS